MTYHWIVPLLAAIATLALAVFVNRVGPQQRVSRVFTFLAAMLVLWNLNFFVLYSVSDRSLAVNLTRIFRVGALFLPPAALHLVVVLQAQRSRSWRVILFADYGLAAALAVANALDLLVSDLRSFAWGYYSVGTRFYNLFSALLIVNLLAVIALLVHDYRTSAEPRMRLQAKFWLLGALVAVPLGCTNLLPAYGIAFYPLGSLGNAAWAGIVAYAIVRHRLMDIDLVVTKGMAYAAVAFVLIAPAFLSTLWMQRISFGHVHPDFSAAVLLMFVLIGILFPRLRLQAETRIEQSLFREKHAYRIALTAFTRSIVQILDREKLVRELATTLSQTFELDRIAIAIADETKHAYTVVFALGTVAVIDEFREEHEIIRSLDRRKRAVLRDELETSPDPTERAVVASVLQENGWEVCIPLMAGSKLIGFLALGRKRNLNAFFAEDLELLETLAAEASVALENARLYEELKKSQDIIRRADRLSALGTLAAGIAHEVRNPLVSIQTFFQLAPDRLHDEEFLTTFLGMTANEVKRISDLITELLSFARSPTRTLKPVDLNETADRVATLLEPEARKHKLTFERTFAPALPLVNADADQIKQVLINLVLNAIQATPPGGVVSLTSRTIRRGNAEFGQLEVRDTGVGIPPDRLDHIFNPFFTTKDKGTGLGLAIAHQIINEHGGVVAVESNEGHGAIFYVDLPASDPGTEVLSANLVQADTESVALVRHRKHASSR